MNIISAQNPTLSNLTMKFVYFSAILFVGVSIEIVLSQRDAAMNLAAQAAAANSGKPVFGVSGAGGGNNGRNWNVGGSVGAGAKVWESHNRRHSVGIAASASQAYGRSQGQSWHSRPDVGVGAGYRYRFG